MLQIQTNSRQVPKTKTICANKKYYDILYAYLQCVSVRDEQDGKRYFYKKDINFSKLAEIFDLTRQTISTKFKNLTELGLVIKMDENTYQLLELEPDIATLIPYKTLKILTDALNQNSISTYVYLLNQYYSNGCKPFVFTIEQIKKYIGISTSTRSNDEVVSNILYILQQIGLIRYSVINQKQEADTFQNVKMVHRLDFLTNTI